MCLKNGGKNSVGTFSKKELFIMKQRKIMLKTIEDAKKFVNASYNRVVIDAKSILGVMSLDLTQILTVEYMGEDAEYEAFLDTMEANNVTAA